MNPRTDVTDKHLFGIPCVALTSSLSIRGTTFRRLLVAFPYEVRPSGAYQWLFHTRYTLPALTRSLPYE